MDEARDHRLELIPTDVTPGETGVIAFGMVSADLGYVQGIARLMLSSVVLTHLNDATRAALGPEPVRIA